MREIKFRAWDKFNNRWAFSTEINIEGSGQVVHNHFKPNYTDSNRVIGCGHLEALQQYIGLKDKNGTEIYEGDIINIWHVHGDTTHIAETVYIAWRESTTSFCFRSDIEESDYPIDFENEDYELEVIGNIYENKELLK